jgi:hypothetical protein
MDYRFDEDEEEVTVVTSDKAPVAQKQPGQPKGVVPPWAAWLYHYSEEPKLFSDRKDYLAHLETGEWHDSPAKCKPPEEKFTPLSKTAITRMKVDERAEWAKQWFGVEYAEDKPAAEIIEDLIKLQGEKVSE